MLLNGLAIIAVVSNHAAHRGLTAMFWWTDQYLPGTTIPNYDQYGSLSYYALIAVIQLAFFSVPSFLFVSGFFIGYTARGSHTALNWKVVRTRIIIILIPYLIWSSIRFLGNWFESCLDGTCQLQQPIEYLRMLITGDTYWFVPLIVQLYLLSPFLVQIAKKNWRILLLIAIFAQLGGLIASYLSIYGIDVHPFFYNSLATIWFPRDLIYSVSGIIIALNLQVFKKWLSRVKWGLLIAVIVSAIFVILETEFFSRTSGTPYAHGHLAGGYLTIPMTFYIFSFIFCFLAFEEITIPFSKTLNKLGNRSYGIYLIHPILFTHFIPRAVYNLAPWLLAYQFLYQPLLIISGIGISMMLMTFVANSRMRSKYRYLFG